MQTTRELSAKNAAEEDAGNQKGPSLPRDVSRLGVFKKRKNASGRNQRNQTGTLRAVLAKSKHQPEKWHQQHATADTHHSSSHPAKRRHKRDTRNPTSAARLLVDVA